MGEKKKGALAINQEYLLYTPHLEKKRRQRGMDYMKVSFLTTVQKTRCSPLIKGVFGLEMWWLFVKGTIPFKYKPHL
jgi:hypothetical protein